MLFRRATFLPLRYRRRGLEITFAQNFTGIYLRVRRALDVSRGIGQVREFSHVVTGVDVPRDDHEALVRETLGTSKSQPDPALSGCR